MLIVNADDWGLRPEVSDAIAECWQAGAITCASAMVHMADSSRAFELAREGEMPLGLHLNLTTPFTAVAVGSDRRQRQGGAVAYFGASDRRRFGFDPLARGWLELCIADQLEAFAESHGRPAAHADGHQHLQVCPTVLSTRALGRLESLRSAHGFVAGPGSPAKGLYRRAVNLIVRARFRTALFVSLRDLHPALGGVGLEGLERIARGTDVEVMVHPAWEDEREVLLSPAWRRLLADLPTGSHVDLS
jgi:chitin disaccharide deacetylase